MAIPKGKSGNPNGRPKGVPNRATMDARAAIAAFVDGNVDRLNGWLDRVAMNDPSEAFKMFMSVIEYHIPKLARTEMQALDKDGEPTDPVGSDADLLKRYGLTITNDKGKN